MAATGSLISLSSTSSPRQPPRHNKEKEAARRALQEAGVEVAASGSVDFRDPWGNHIQVVDYREIQFTKADAVLRGMGLEGLEKNERALAELRSKGLTET